MDALAVVLMIFLVISTAAGAVRFEAFLQRNGTTATRARQAKHLGYGLAIIFAALLVAFVIFG